MADHNTLGETGEELAWNYLAGQGYQLLARNWRHGRDELDIVARQGREVVVVEVKTRSTGRFGEPLEAVGPVKQRRLTRAAEAFLESCPEEDLEVRFDIIGIVMEGNRPRLEHIKDAFYHTPDDEEA
jgi:putative endonuclease